MSANRTPNSRKVALREFDLAWLRLGQTVLEAKMNHLVSWKNALTLRHGHGWEFVREDTSTGGGGMLRSTAEVTVKHEAVASHDLTAFRVALDSFTDQFVEQMSRRTYEVVSEAADAVGNVVTAPDGGSLAEMFLQMIEKVDFGVDEHGKVAFPEFHTTPVGFDRMVQAVQAQGPEFQQQVEAVKKRKIEEAIAREQARRARYNTEHQS